VKLKRSRRKETLITAYEWKEEKRESEKVDKESIAAKRNGGKGEIMTRT